MRQKDRKKVCVCNAFPHQQHTKVYYSKMKKTTTTRKEKRIQYLNVLYSEIVSNNERGETSKRKEKKENK